MGSGDRPGRRAPGGRLGGRADRRGRAARVASGHAADLPSRAPPSRRSALLQRCHRFQCLITDQDGETLAALELRRCARECGLSNLPFRDFAPNAVWLELVLMAQDLLAHTSSLCLEGGLARAEPKRLRQRVLHVAGRLTRSGRRVTLHLPRRWPWAEALLPAFGPLRSLPPMAWSPVGGHEGERAAGAGVACLRRRVRLPSRRRSAPLGGPAESLPRFTVNGDAGRAAIFTRRGLLNDRG